MDKKTIRYSGTVVKMNFVRYIRGCTKTDKIRYEIIRSDLNNISIKDKIEVNKMKWKDRIDIMVQNKLPKKIMNYRPIKRDIWVDLVIGGLMIETGTDDITLSLKAEGEH